MFSYYYIICRSLTYAQRTQRVLRESGIQGAVLRAPKEISVTGCSYCVRIAAKKLAPALEQLNQAGLSPLKVYAGDPEGAGGFREVPL
jgi:hypothetical protein